MVEYKVPSWISKNHSVITYFENQNNYINSEKYNLSFVFALQLGLERFCDTKLPLSKIIKTITTSTNSPRTFKAVSLLDFALLDKAARSFHITLSIYETPWCDTYKKPKLVHTFNLYEENTCEIPLLYFQTGWGLIVNLNQLYKFATCPTCSFVFQTDRNRNKLKKHVKVCKRADKDAPVPKKANKGFFKSKSNFLDYLDHPCGLQLTPEEKNGLFNNALAIFDCESMTVKTSNATKITSQLEILGVHKVVSIAVSTNINDHKKPRVFLKWNNDDNMFLREFVKYLLSAQSQAKLDYLQQPTVKKIFKKLTRMKTSAEIKNKPNLAKIYSNALTKLETYATKLCVIGYNSNSFDIPLLRDSGFFELLFDLDGPINVIKKNNCYPLVQSKSIRLLDCILYEAGKISLRKYLESLINEIPRLKHHLDYSKKLFFPYKKLDIADKLVQSPFPLYTDFYDELTESNLLEAEFNEYTDLLKRGFSPKEAAKALNRTSEPPQGVEIYAELMERWKSKNFVNLLDILIDYNKADTEPLLIACEYKRKHLFELLEEDCFGFHTSLPSLALKYYMKNTNHKFITPQPHFRTELEQNICGGLSVVLQHYLELFKSKIRPHCFKQQAQLAKSIESYDQNSMYGLCLQKPLPVDCYLLREKNDFYLPRIIDQKIHKSISWMYWEDRLIKSDGNIQHRLQKGEQFVLCTELKKGENLLAAKQSLYDKMNEMRSYCYYNSLTNEFVQCEAANKHPLQISDKNKALWKNKTVPDSKFIRYRLDGFIPASFNRYKVKICLEFDECFNSLSHANCLDHVDDPQKSTETICTLLNKTWTQIEKKSLKKRALLATTQNIHFIFISSCYWDKLISRDQSVKDFVDNFTLPCVSRVHKKQYTTEVELIDDVLSDKIMGFVSAKVEIPTYMWNKCHIIPPIFTKKKITEKDLSIIMQNYNNKHRLFSGSKTILTTIFNAADKNKLYMTHYLKYLISNFDAIVTNVTHIYEFKFEPCFATQVGNCIEKRKEAIAKDNLIAATTWKTLVNSGYGQLLLNESKFKEAKFFKSNSKQINLLTRRPEYQDMIEIGFKNKDDYLEIISSQRTIKYKTPYQLGAAILFYAKIELLSFIYNFICKYVPPQNICPLTIDTDSFMFSLSEQSLEDSIDPAMKEEFDREKYHYLDISNSKVPGLWKKEFHCTNPNTRFVGLCAKTFVTEEGGNEPNKKKKCSAKGVMRKIKKNSDQLRVNVFKDVLIDLIKPADKPRLKQTHTGIMKRKTEEGVLVTYKLEKVGLSAFDTKVKTLRCGIHCRALEYTEENYEDCNEFSLLTSNTQ